MTTKTEQSWANVTEKLAGVKIKVREGYHHPLIPAVDDKYVWPEYANSIIAAIEADERVLLVGPASTGKSSLMKQIAAKKRQPVMKVNLNRDIAMSDFIGHFIVKNGAMEFQYGVLPTAMLQGHILLLEEIDAMQAATAFTLQSVLEPNGILLILDTGEHIAPHPNFRICATANTRGYGDASALYSVGTNLMNHSQIDRWSFVWETSFLTVEQETELLRSYFPELPQTEQKGICQAAATLRMAFGENKIHAPITLRSILGLCRARERKASWTSALQATVLNKSPQEDARMIREVFQRFVGLS